MPATPFRLGELNRETEYVLKALGLEVPELLGELDEKQPVAIVDTNNPAELPDDLEKASIHSIIDHHKLCGGLKTSAPIDIDLRTLCSTGSILYARAKAAGRVPPKKIAGLLLSCILSDSLEFRSPTTTEQDKVFAHELAELAGLDLHKHAEAMLDAKAEISHLSPAQLVMMDSKTFEIGGRKVRISVIETTRPERALRQRAALVEAQQQISKEQGLDDTLLFVVDVLKEQATFISASATASRMVEAAWSRSVGEDGTVVIPDVLSRKKQIIPQLEEGARADLLAAEQEAEPTVAGRKAVGVNAAGVSTA